MTAAIIMLTLLGVAAGGGLGLAAWRWRGDEEAVIERIDALLPQSQCAQCGYPGCRPYAEAIARGDADINLCPPGGEATVRRLADLLGREPQPLALDDAADPALAAQIDENRCIGCARCLEACPVDAIVGAHQRMHTVITDECTGCELCLEPCPVDCIDLVPRDAAEPSAPAAAARSG